MRTGGWLATTRLGFALLLTFFEIEAGSPKMLRAAVGGNRVRGRAGQGRPSGTLPGQVLQLGLELYGSSAGSVPLERITR